MGLSSWRETEPLLSQPFALTGVTLDKRLRFYKHPSPHESNEGMPNWWEGRPERGQRAHIQIYTIRLRLQVFNHFQEMCKVTGTEIHLKIKAEKESSF